MSRINQRRRRGRRKLLTESLEVRRVLDSTVVFNEIMYNPAGDDGSLEWIELHNQMSVDMNISGWALENAVDFTFPAGARLEGGGHLIVASDPERMRSEFGIQDALGPFSGRLANSGESLELRNHTGRLMNLLEYDDGGDWSTGADGSGSSLMKRRAQDASEPAKNWTFSPVPGGTPGTANQIGAAAALEFKEVTSANADPFWLELHNRSDQSLSTLGYVLALNGQDADFVLPQQTIAPGAHLVINATDLGFDPQSGDNLFLYAPERAELLDAVAVSDTLQGRASERAARWQTPSAPTPGAENAFAFEDDIVINEIMYNARPDLAIPPVVTTSPILRLDATWRFDQSGTDLGSDWRETAFDDSGWESGQGLFFVENGVLPGEKNTPLTLGHQTYYFRTTFEWDGETQHTELGVSHVVDDGAVFYLNGSELARYRMPDGPISFDTEADSSVNNANTVGPLSIPEELLVKGTNTIAVEVHQRSAGSSDVVFGAQIDQLRETEPATPFAGSSEEWIELFNRSDRAIDLSGWQLSDAVDFQFPTGTAIDSGGYLVVARDPVVLAALHPDATIIGPIAGRLNDKTDRILLADQLGNIADEVNYFDGGRWADAADGGGSTLELRDPDADNSLAEAWAASDESDRSTWNSFSYTQTVSSVAFDPPINFHEFVMGMLRAGEVLVDNISVIEDPGPNGVELIQNGSFNADAAGDQPAKWRIQGTHEQSEVIEDPDQPGNRVLRLVAGSRMNYLSNHAETTLADGARVVNGRTYQISFDAKWISGSPQLHTELYYKDAARTTILPQPTKSGTPGMRNTAWQDNLGPTYDHLRHEPLVPLSTDPVTVTVAAADPDGMAAMTLMYSVEGDAVFTSVAMSTGADGRYQAEIPAQANRDVVQFYVLGEDQLGGTSTFPAAGPDSRALYRVDDLFSLDDTRHDFRIIMTPDDQRTLHDRVNMVNNNRLGSTVIYDADEVFYDVGARLKGSMFSRQNRSTTGYNVRFGSDQLFRGVHDTVRFDQNGEAEILVKYLAAAAGNLGGSYDDVMQLTTPSGSGGGPTLTFLAAHDNLFLDEQFENGADGTLFKMEGIRVMTSTVDRNDPESLKLFQPIGWVGNFDIADLGNDKELYRWPYLIHNNRDRDDFSRLIELAQAFSLTGEALDAALIDLIDVDQWMSTFAIMSLFGIGDAYTQGNPHNLNIYVRPSDNKVLAFPWDWDFVFSQTPTAPIHGNKNMGRVLDRPVFERIFMGHLNHLIKNSFNLREMEYWNDHFGTLLRQNFRSFLGRYDQRGNFVLNRLPEETPFGVGDGGNLETSEFVLDTSPVSVLVPTPANGGDQLGLAWTEVDFNQSADWIDGANGIGFEPSPDDYADLIQFDVSQQMLNVNSSIYIRMPFQADASEFDRLKLRMKYDDGFVAYLNGVKIAEANAPSPAEWNATATRSNRDSDAVNFASFDVTEHLSAFRTGQNVLAIHGMNRSASGSDALFLAEFIGETIIEKPPEEITVDTDSVLINGRGWVDVRHIRLAGESEPLDVTWPDTTTWEANLPLQPGRNELTLEAVDLAGKVIGTTRINVTSEAERPLLEHLRISEIMYNPAAPSDAERVAGFDDQDEFEFIELLNTSATISLPLDAVSIAGGIQFQFSATTLQPGERAVVARNAAAFQLRYGNAIPVAGQYQGRLSNGGEAIELLDGAGATIVDLEYGDSDPWPARADGAGGSLELVDPLNTPIDEMSRSHRWRASVPFGGSPGSAGIESVGIIINEILANSDPPSLDSIELWNPTSQTIDVGGWYLSDSAANLLKYQLPAGTLIAAGQFLVLDESHFNPTPLNPGPRDFALNGSRGDDVWLVVPNQQGGIEQFVDDVHFGATRSGESLGRVTRSSARLAPLTALTFGASNAAPRVGPVVLSELQVHPPAPSPNAVALDGNITVDDLEYIELVNTGTEAVDLSRWTLNGGVDIEFNDGTNLAAGGSLLVLSFNPQLAANADRLAAFRAHYNLADDTPQLVGGFGGQLSDNGELIQLLRAATIAVDPDEISLLLEDEVLYQLRPPWPVGVSGSGHSLHRTAATAWGNAPSSWRAAATTPDSAAFVNSDLNGDGQTDALDVDLLCGGLRGGDQQFDLNADGTADLGDLSFMIEVLLGTSFGDANLDGGFNSSDLVSIFRAGEYDDGLAENSTWAEGDWNCDREFDSSDLVAAFRAGGFVAAVGPSRASRSSLGAALDQPPTETTVSRVEASGEMSEKQVKLTRPIVLESQRHDQIFAQLGQPAARDSDDPKSLQVDAVDELTRDLERWL